MTRRRQKKDRAARQHDLAARGIEPACRIELPPGAVWADCSQQVPWNSYSSPPVYYEDIDFVCIDCGSAETWTAVQQKWYYEVAKGELYATAVRCRPCRQWVRANRHAAKAQWSFKGILRRIETALEGELQQRGYDRVPPHNHRLEFDRSGSRITFGYGVANDYGPPSALIARHQDCAGSPVLIATLQLTHQPTRLSDERFNDWLQAVRRFVRNQERGP